MRTGKTVKYKNYTIEKSGGGASIKEGAKK